MPFPSLPARAARATLRWIPRRVRNLVPLATRQRVLGWSTPKGHPRPPVLSVVIPVYNVEEYLPQCLDSVLNQTLNEIEILAVDDGSTDGSLAILESYAAAHPRIRVFAQANAGQGAARNLAVGHARGRFLTFLDADDIIPRDAYEYMVRTLRRSGSDFCVGSVRRVSNGRSRPAPWPAAVHERDRIGIRIEDFPDAMQDVIACNRMFRRQYWVDKVGGFRGGIAYEDHVPMVAAYIRATRFDVLAKVTYWWRIRENQTSTGQQKHELRNLLDRIEVKAEAQQIVQAEASTVVMDAWVGRVLDTDFPPFVNHALRGDDEYRAALEQAYRRYLDLASPAALRHVRVQQKVRGWLASRGRWDELEAAQRWFAENGAVPATRVEDGRIYAEVPIREELDPQLPDAMLELGALESAFGGALQRAVWTDEQTLEVTGWAYVKGLDLTGTVPETRARLVEATTGATVDLDVAPLVLPDATRWSGNLHANYDTSAFRARVQVAELAREGLPADARWQLLVSVAARGLEREGSLHHAVEGGSASRHILRGVHVRDGSVQVFPLFDAALGFSITVRPAEVRAVELATTPGERTVTGRLAWDVQALGEATHVRAVQKAARQTVEGVLVADPAGGYRFSLDLPVTVGDAGRPVPTEWELRMVTTQGTTRPVHWAAPQDAAATGPRGIGQVAWRRSPRRYARLVADAPLLQLVDVDITDDRFRVRLVVDGLTPAELGSLTLSSTQLDVPADTVEHSDGVVTVDLPTRVPRFGGPALTLPSGPYWLQVTDARGDVHVAQVHPDLLQRLPLDAATPSFNARTWVSGTAAELARVSISPGLRPEERGNWAQRQLRTWYQQADLEPEHAVLLQCYRGEVATDSQRALHEGLVRRGSDLTLYWGVASNATWVPEGGVRLVIGSRQWYEKLARVEYLSNNIDFDGFFRKRPHQRYLQTFHGYPFKSMGRTFWAAKGFTPDRIELENERRNREWDAIVVPSAMCEPMYRTEYDYTGEVLVTGYPRSDALVGADPGARQQVLQRLGVDPGKTVVLYAPTFRDALTTKTYAAKRFDALDLEVLTDGLGEDHVLLLRGHNNNQREPERMRGRARVVDVTDYPEINDLTLAADVAVLDYSSLRFDWALTGKPMVFFVPDLDDYFLFRPPLFDFRASAPGPLLSTTEEVVGALSDLDAVRAGWGDAIRDFNATYNELNDGKATDRVLDAFFTARR